MPKEDKNAPKRCEVCDERLPTWKDREKHMKKTNHCRCGECGDYIPPGGTEAHLLTAHRTEPWNDHMAAWSDRVDLENAQPWARRKAQKAKERATSAKAKPAKKGASKVAKHGQEGSRETRRSVRLRAIESASKKNAGK